MNRFAAAAIAAGCGVLAGSLYLAVLVGSTGGLMLVYLTQLPLFVAGLWFGTSGAAIAGLAATLVLFAASDLVAAALFAALNAVPVTILVRQALLARQSDGAVRWYPPGLLAAWLTAMALAGIAIALVVAGGPAGMQAEMRDAVAAALDRLVEQTVPNRTELIDGVVLVIPGIIASAWMVMAVINGVLAQGLVARFGANWRPSPELARLSLPLWLPLLLTAAAIGSAFSGMPRFLAINTLIVMLVPFGLAGLAVLHRAVRRLSHPVAVLIAFYVFAGLFGWPLLAVAVLGLFETWLGLRRRLIRPGESTHG